VFFAKFFLSLWNFESLKFIFKSNSARFESTQLLLLFFFFVATIPNNFLSTQMHRVSNPVIGSPSASQDRLSIVFFTGPPSDTLVEVLPECYGDIASPKYPPVLAGAHLSGKLKASNIK